MKKRWVVVILVLMIILIITSKVDMNNLLLKMNWGIFLQKPNKVDIIYRFDYKEGDDFEIWTYNKLRINKIIDNNKFELITSKNIEEIKDIFNSYYNTLSYNEERQKQFKSHFYIDKMIVENNYFSITYGNEDRNNFLLLLIDTKDNKLYYFNHIR